MASNKTYKNLNELADEFAYSVFYLKDPTKIKNSIEELIKYGREQGPTPYGTLAAYLGLEGLLNMGKPEHNLYGYFYTLLRGIREDKENFSRNVNNLRDAIIEYSKKNPIMGTILRGIIEGLQIWGIKTLNELHEYTMKTLENIYNQVFVNNNRNNKGNNGYWLSYN